jgi:O-antigen/teichoic acid export membrane protein
MWKAGKAMALPNSPPPRASAVGPPLVRGKRVEVIAARLLGIAAGVLASMVAARALDQETFGRLNVLLNQVSFWSIVASLGFNRLLVRLLAQRLAEQDAAGAADLLTRGFRCLYASLVVVGTTLGVGLAWFGLELTGVKVTVPQACGVAFLIALYGWHQVTGELYRGLDRERLAGWFGAPPGGVGPLSGTLSLVAVIALAQGGGLTLDRYLAAHAILAAILLWPAWRGLNAARRARIGTPPHYAASSTTAEGSLLALAWPLVALQALIFLASQADVWIAGRELPEEQVAAFSAAKRLSVFITLPLQLMQLTTVATIAQLHAAGDLLRLQHVLQRAALLAFVPATLITLAALLFPGTLLSLMYGAPYATAAPLLQALSLGAWLITATGLCSLTLIMTGHDRVAFPVTALAALLLVVGGTLATRWYGAWGLAVCSSVVLGISNVAQWWLARVHSGVWVHPGWSRWPRAGTIS